MPDPVRSINSLCFSLAFCETFQYVGADGCRYTKPSSTFRSSFVPADGTGAASYESGDFDTSPFLGSPGASRRPPLPMYLWYREQSTMVQRESYCIGSIDDDGLKIKRLCHSKVKEGAVRRCYFDLRSIPSTSSAARTSFKPVVARNTLIRGLTIRGCWEGQTL